MDYVDILRIAQLVVSFLSGSFVLIVVIKNFVKWIEITKLDAQEKKAKKIAEQEKELYIALKEKYEKVETK